MPTSCLPCFKTKSLKWHQDMKGHAFGVYSMAAAQANSVMEDQSQVMVSPFGTFIGVYDGHGGQEASVFVRNNLYKHIENLAAEEGGVSAEVIRKSIHATEADFSQQTQRPTVGTVCAVGFITPDRKLYTANLGDCRAVMGVSTFCFQTQETIVYAERLTRDHNVVHEDVREELKMLHPDDPDIVVWKHGNWRVKGLIQVSRAIGDFYFKTTEPYGICKERPILTAEPYIYSRELKEEDKFLIFASDGLWDQLTDQEAVDIIHSNPPKGIAKLLLRAAIEKAAYKSNIKYSDMKKIKMGDRRLIHDDISVVVIYLDHGWDSRSMQRRSCAAECTIAPDDIFSSDCSSKRGFGLGRMSHYFPEKRHKYSGLKSKIVKNFSNLRPMKFLTE